MYYFYGSFKPEFFMWEAVGFLHKMLLAVIAAKASVMLEPGVPLFIATWVVLSQFVLELRYQAYKRKLEGRLIKITLFGLLALVLAAQGLAVAKLVGDTGFQEVTRVVAGVAVIFVIAYCVVALCPERGQEVAQTSGKSAGWRVFRTFSGANPMFKSGKATGALQPVPAARKSELRQRARDTFAATTAPQRGDRTLSTAEKHNAQL